MLSMPAGNASAPPKPRRREPYARSETRRPERGRNTVAVLADRKIRTKTAQMGRIWL
jgi:hypothetical protein